MEEQEDSGMDTTYVGIMLAVFLVLAALAIDIGYLYVSDEDLLTAAEKSSLAGADAIKKRMLSGMRSNDRVPAGVLNDPVQAAARAAAVEAASGKHASTALIHIANNDTNRLSDGNDVTVGFWNATSHTYTPGATPVNAMQVRTRRTAESETVGLGSVGTILARLSGVENFNYTPEAISAFPPRATANFAICASSRSAACRYPSVCSGETRVPRSADPQPGDLRYAYTTLLHQTGETMGLSELICLDLPPQEVCGKQILVTTGDASDYVLRDLESMMYNPNVDPSNKELEGDGAPAGWWVIAPVVECGGEATRGFERRRVSGYALVRISRICVDGPPGCRQNGTSFKAPQAACRGERGLYIDRISFVDCGSRDMLQFPGLRPVLVK
ncbi:MAG TPA: TadG family pilus assembly protein [Verrucomicrobiae bacterium]|nr:TadG family pilus assembly protein [Verrucomicrobiae bacterium]